LNNFETSRNLLFPPYLVKKRHTRWYLLR